MNNKSVIVDILMPLYGEVSTLKECLERILKFTNLKKHRLLIICDKSIDESVFNELAVINLANVVLVSVSERLGFVERINKGIEFSEKNDVLLLEPNTKVTYGWLDKIIRCAYNDAGIGTVLPLSNNVELEATLLDNKNIFFPSGMDLDEYASEIERISLHCYSDISPRNASCILIKRSVLDEVGFFYQEVSGLQSDEINAFFGRVSKLGYRHVVCDDTFVYNDVINLNENNQKFVENSNFLLINQNIDIYRKLNLNKEKKNLLYLIQADFREDASNNIGGTQLHVKDLTEGLREKYNIFVVARDGENLNVTAYVAENKVSFVFYIGKMESYYVFRNKKFFDLYSNLLLAFKIDLVHVHHTMGVTHEIYYAAKKYNVPIYLTLHDYYYICPTLRLLDDEKKSCIGSVDTEKCEKCIKTTMPVYEGVEFITKWRKEHRKVLNMCQKIIIPTKSAAEVILQYYPEIGEKIEVISHGIDNKIFYKEENKKPYQHSELRVAFVGGISETKGSELIYQMIVNNPDKYKWYIMGGIDGELNFLEQDNLVKTGWYKREELNHLLGMYEIDVVCILSKVAETYCYTLSEVVACGIPVIVTDIGALGERMKEMKCGWVVSKDARYTELYKVLLHIENMSKEYCEKYMYTQKYKMRTSKEMVSQYRKLYSDIKKINFGINIYDSKSVLEAYNTSVDLIKTYMESRNKEGENVLVETKAKEIFDEYAESTLFWKRELKKVYDSKIFKVTRKGVRILKKIKCFKL